MKICKVCGAQMDDDENVCKYCRSAVNRETIEIRQGGSRQKVRDAEEESLALKYKDFLNDDALYKFGMCKLSGIGVEKSEAEAFQIFQTLSYRGHLDAMFKLAEMYERMDPPELEAAAVWLKIAADNGHEPSRIKLRSIIGLVAPELYENKPIEIPREFGSFEDLVRQALPNVVLIRNGKSNGAGFIVQGGYIITNAHVLVQRSKCIYAQFESKHGREENTVLLQKIFPEFDIAVLKFPKGMVPKMKAGDYLRLRCELPAYGEDIYTIGNPLGVGFSISRGIVSCPNQKTLYLKAVDEMIQIDITANHGNSGGALLDRYNNVLGILTGIPKGSRGGITMCVPAKYIAEALNRL